MSAGEALGRERWYTSTIRSVLSPRVVCSRLRIPASSSGEGRRPSGVARRLVGLRLACRQCQREQHQQREASVSLESGVPFRRFHKSKNWFSCTGPTEKGTRTPEDPRSPSSKTDVPVPDTIAAACSALFHLVVRSDVQDILGMLLVGNLISSFPARRGGLTELRGETSFGLGRMHRRRAGASRGSPLVRRGAGEWAPLKVPARPAGQSLESCLPNRDSSSSRQTAIEHARVAADSVPWSRRIGPQSTGCSSRSRRRLRPFGSRRRRTPP